MLAMIVEDSSAVRKIIVNIARELGFDTVEAEHGKSALAALDVAPATPDLILIDWNMPVMDGLELVTALRAQERYRKLPLVMVTTETEIGKVVKALEAGANEYIMKPFTKEMLEEKIELLGIPRLTHGKDTNPYRG